MPANATPLQQAYYYTPTANPDGRIIYIVRPGDSCTSIYILTGATIDDIRMYNDLGEDCLLSEGQELVLGVAEEPTVPIYTPTPTSSIPTETPFPGNAEVCVYLFEDVNGNAMAEEGEMPLGGGAASITDQTGAFSQTLETTGAEEPVCFTDVPEGDYNVSVAIPEGFNATTILNYPLTVQAGDQALLDFGAQVSAVALPPTGQEGQEGKSPILAIVGGVLVLGGIGLGIYFRSLVK